MNGLRYKQAISLEVEIVVKEPDNTVVKQHSHPNSQSSDGEDADDEDAIPNKKDKPDSVDASELEMFWRYYIA
jgi:hypothetical protein